MEESKETKDEIRRKIFEQMGSMTEKKKMDMTMALENRLFDFANFVEAKIAMLYMNKHFEIPSAGIIQRSFKEGKIVVLPAFDKPLNKIKLFKVDDIDAETVMGARDIREPDVTICKAMPIERLDIAIIPGLAFDEKGGRIGSGDGYYDRLIPHLPITARKVALAFEEQLLPQINMESHDKYVDIIITEERTIYKI